MSSPHVADIAQLLALPPRGVGAVLELLEEGATVPFVARYRKERTGSLDEVQIRDIADRALYLKELDQRRETILSTIEEQGKLDDALRARIHRAKTKSELEDLYLPFKKKRRTKATMARERGLEPLADLIAAQPLEGSPEAAAKMFVDADREVPDVEAALAGACDILIERLVEDPDARTDIRRAIAERGQLASSKTPKAKKAGDRTKFDDFDSFQEPLKSIPSHRFLAVRRGQAEGILRTKVEADLDHHLPGLAKAAGARRDSPFCQVLERVAQDALARLKSYAETAVLGDTKQRADDEAVAVFAENLKALLLAAPLGPKPVIGIDPGIRTGCKLAVVDATGRFLETATVFLSQGDAKKAEAERVMQRLVEQHQPSAIAVGNGTYGRETEAWLRPWVAKHGGAKGTSNGEARGEGAETLFVVSVNEAGASVYSASDVAREEFPELDLTVRGAISIARRLQDPLAELVKTDPKSIGVGQYQHDVDQRMLQKKLDDVVEDCVNQVGVELNTASAPLLARVAGIGAGQAKRIVQHREATGPFVDRRGLLKVSGLGPKAFEQCAGFLRVRESQNPLDRSAVHPERYALVKKMAADAGLELASLVGSGAAQNIDVKRYVSEDVGEPTLLDILAELKRPGRDPRQSFEPPKFRDDVNELADLKPGMKLEGVVTNVTAFGAFVDVGVHQDGLVHISQLADRFVKDPHEVVRSGDRLKVTVLDVDLERRRIGLSAKAGSAPPPAKPANQPPRRHKPKAKKPQVHKPQAHKPQGQKGKGDGRAELKHNPFAALKRKP